MVLGGGATATSVLLALAERGMRHATLVVRDPDRAAETVHAVAAHRSAPAVEVRTDRRGRRRWPDDVLVSTVPASAQVPDLVAAVADVPLVFDVVYEPWPTPLAAAAERSGRTVLSGLDLLVAQAVNQVVAMTGRYDVPGGRDAARGRGGPGGEVGAVTDLYPVTAVATGVLGLVAGALVPRLIASVPEPEPDGPEERRAPRQPSADEADEPRAGGAEGALRRHRGPARARLEVPRVAVGGQRGGARAGPRLELVAARGAAAGPGRGRAGRGRLADPAAAAPG